MRWIRIATTLALVCAAAFSYAQLGLLRLWTAPGGGAYANPFNWDPFGVPEPGDAVGFDLDATYTVSFAGDRTVASLLVSDGEITVDRTEPNVFFAYSVGSLTIAGDGTVLGFERGRVNAGSALVRDGGTLRFVQSGSLTVAPGALVVRDGGTLDLLNGADLVTSSETTVIESGGVLNLVGQGTLAAELELNGNLLIDGGTFNKVDSTRLSIAGEEITIRNGGQVNWASVLNIPTDVDFTITVDGTGSAFTQTESPSTRLKIGGESTGASFTTSNEEFAGLTVRETGQVNLGSGGSLNVQSLDVQGRMTIGAAPGPSSLNLNGSANLLINGGNVTLIDGTINARDRFINLTDDGTFDFLGGTLIINGFGDDLLNQAGTFTPDSVAQIFGDYIQQEDAAFLVEIAGVVPGQFGTVTVFGNAILAGTLEIVVLDDFVPALGNTFSTIETEFGNVSGEFDTFVSPTIDGLTFDVSYDSTSVVLEVVEADVGQCGDPVGDELLDLPRGHRAAIVTASDALFVLRAAVGSEQCLLCVCDADGGGSLGATDALVVLKAAVGQQVELACPTCT